MVSLFVTLWRWWLIVSGIAVFFWLSLEDTTSLWVALLGTNLTASIVSHRARHMGFDVRVLWHWLAFGGVVGASSTLMVTFLMFFKTAWHSHDYPDFPPLMMLDMLMRLPVWTLAGILIGCAGYALQRALKPAGEADKTHHLHDGASPQP